MVDAVAEVAEPLVLVVEDDRGLSMLIQRAAGTTRFAHGRRCQRSGSCRLVDA